MSATQSTMLVHGVVSSTPSSSVSRSCPSEPVKPSTRRCVTLSLFSKLRVVVRSAVPRVNVASAATKKPLAGTLCPERSTTASMTPLPPVPSPMTTYVSPSRAVAAGPSSSKYSSTSLPGSSMRISERKTSPVVVPEKNARSTSVASVMNGFARPL